MFYMLFFGIIAGRVAVAKDGLIEWVLRKVGIRLVPDSLGATFVKAFVWVTGASILFAHWKDSAPGWLSSWHPPNAPSSCPCRWSPNGSEAIEDSAAK